MPIGFACGAWDTAEQGMVVQGTMYLLTGRRGSASFPSMMEGGVFCAVTAQGFLAALHARAAFVLGASSRLPTMIPPCHRPWGACPLPASEGRT